MSLTDLRALIRRFESDGQLARVTAPVSCDQEITIIQHRVQAAGGPALLFENVIGSPYRLASNLFGTPQRVRTAFGRDPAEIGQFIMDLVHGLTPPTLRSLWSSRGRLRRLMSARLRSVRSGPVLQTCTEPPQLDRLPVLTCWPLDGGAFFTLPLVHTIDPATGVGNLGIYRLQRFDAACTGMHWQIEKGGGFHFQKACAMGQPLPVSVILGGPPALTLAAIAPMPEGIDERLLAALIMGQPLDLLQRDGTGHRIPAAAEFVLEGTVSAGDTRQEGPFGDHLGHYSHSSPFPVLRVQRVLARKDAIFPATVVGKPPQEDYYIGQALQEMTLPLLKMTSPGVADLWAYPETGFHPLAVAAVRQRYAREGLKHALGILGQGQLSLTKVLIVVDEGVPVRDFRAVSRALWQNLDPADGLHLLAPTAQDTLDFTGPSPNTGSRLILLATSRASGALCRPKPQDPPAAGVVHPGITAMARVGEGVLAVQVASHADHGSLREALIANPLCSQYPLIVLVSSDVPLTDPCLVLWGWFTRFDPLADLHPARREAAGNRLILHCPIVIDATWKSGYRKPVEFDPDIARRVDANWDRYGINLTGRSAP
ncbi:MAG: UbiD family decarboxylase [Planctomycetaceae bacterium]|nr:UbiD family decarboxylase [Planctomycetaceae bacterium]